LFGCKGGGDVPRRDKVATRHPDHKIYGKSDNENNERITGLRENANRSQQEKKLFTLKVTQELVT